MKIIFLDVDGVLNCRERWVDCESADPEWPGTTRIDPRAVERLKRIVEATGARIVVSSTWRLYHFEALCQYLGMFGLKVSDKTPDWPDGLRGDEIGYWIAHHEDLVENFVILDDDSDMGELLTYLVKTSFDTGLQDEHVEQAIRILNGGSL